MPTPQEKIQALQYLFDVARQAPVAAVVHEQAAKYATLLANSFNETPPATAADRAAKADVNSDTQIG